MLYGIALPPYELVRKYESQGNWAVKKYYQFPFNIFYKKKLRMIIDMLQPGKIYRNILDFGGGPAQIFKKELGKHAMSVTSYNLPIIDPRWKFDVIVCASVLEFVSFQHTLKGLSKSLAPRGFMVVASPMDNWITRLYFWAIGDKNLRHTHTQMLKQLERYFDITEYKSWLGLYFACKAVPK